MGGVDGLVYEPVSVYELSQVNKPSDKTYGSSFTLPVLILVKQSHEHIILKS